ncbi:MAG: nitrile hydratase subunit beta [Proteobacteria bacterium]|nr:MAG: nitrile hydratase subunit beta [Pseudomonadota bacterium]
MNGAHDLGGLHGLGPIDPEPEDREPVFHHGWERRAFALTLACGFLGQWNLDESRAARERQHPVDYLRNSYYENWLAGLEALLVEKGVLSGSELADARAECPAPKALLERVPGPARIADVLERGGPVDVQASRRPVFRVGEYVRVINRHPLSHTRAPRYVRGRIGRLAAHQGCHVFADANSAGERRGEHLYSVRFAANELWGEPAGRRDAVYVDLFEPYLEPIK